MSDDNTPVDPLARRAAQVEAEGKAIGGAEAWEGVVRNMGQKMERGEVSVFDLRQRLAKPNAAGELFNENIADCDESTWRAWRDAQPKNGRVSREPNGNGLQRRP
jgi:hypothetical protein